MNLCVCSVANFAGAKQRTKNSSNNSSYRSESKNRCENIPRVLGKGFNRQNRKVAQKTNRHHPNQMRRKWEITKAYEFICVVSVKPMCHSPKFSMPNIYQRSIEPNVAKPLFILLIRNDHDPNPFAQMHLHVYYKWLFNNSMSFTFHAIPPYAVRSMGGYVNYKCTHFVLNDSAKILWWMSG